MLNSAFITLNFVIATVSLFIFAVGLTIFYIKFKRSPTCTLVFMLTFICMDFLMTFLNIGVV